MTGLLIFVVVYSYSNEEQKSLIAITQEVLSGAAHVKEELRTYTERCFGQISRVLGHLELGYHHVSDECDLIRIVWMSNAHSVSYSPADQRSILYFSSDLMRRRNLCLQHFRRL